jgi:hypothetical protein
MVTPGTGWWQADILDIAVTAALAQNQASAPKNQAA